MPEPANDTAPVTFLQHLSAEIDHLTTGDRPERAKSFAGLIRASCASWDQRFHEQQLATRWSFLEAVVARMDACYKAGTEEHSLKLQPLIRTLNDLIRDSDLTWLRACPRRRTLCRRFAMPQQIPDLASGEGKQPV